MPCECPARSSPVHEFARRRRSNAAFLGTTEVGDVGCALQAEVYMATHRQVHLGAQRVLDLTQGVLRSTHPLRMQAPPARWSAARTAARTRSGVLVSSASENTKSSRNNLTVEPVCCAEHTNPDGERGLRLSQPKREQLPDVRRSAWSIMTRARSSSNGDTRVPKSALLVDVECAAREAAGRWFLSMGARADQGGQEREQSPCGSHRSLSWSWMPG